MKNFNLKVFQRVSQNGNKYLKFILSDNEGRAVVVAPVFANDFSTLLSMSDNVIIEEEKKDNQSKGVA